MQSDSILCIKVLSVNAKKSRKVSVNARKLRKWKNGCDIFFPSLPRIPPHLSSSLI